LRPHLKIAVVAAGALLGLALGFTLALVPGWVAERLQAALVARAEKRGVHLHIGHLWLDPLGPLVLDDVRLQDAHAAAPFVAVARVGIDWELDGLLRPKVWLGKIAIIAPQLTLQRAADGRWNVQAALEKLLLRRDDDDDDEGGGGGLRRYLSKHVPDVEVQGLTARFDDERQGPPLRLGGVDLRHLRVAGGSLVLHNASPVQEKADLRWEARGKVTGLRGALKVTGALQWPEAVGSLDVALPEGMAVSVDGWRAQVARLQVHSDRRIVLGGVQLTRDGQRGQVALDVTEVALRLRNEPGPELPLEVAERVPSVARPLLRYVEQVEVNEPVIVASRPASSATASDDEDEDDEPATPERGAAGKPAPKGNGKTAVKPKSVPTPSATPAKTADGKPGVSPNSGHRPEHDGHIVRERLAGLCTRATERLETQLGRLRSALAALPVPVVTVAHGRARYEDERAGPAGELSDFHARLERKGASKVALSLRFDVAGRKGEQNAITGEVDTASGDARLQVQLQQLPLQPYAALLPGAVTAGPGSAVQACDAKLLFDATTRRIVVEGAGTVAHVALDVPRISRHRLEDLTLTARGKLALDLAQQTAQLDDGEIVVGQVHALVKAKLARFAKAPAFDWRVDVPTVLCQEVVAAVPRGFAPLLDGLLCSGPLSFSFRGALDTADMNTLRLDWEPALGEVAIASMGKYIRFDVFEGPFEHHARQKDGSLHTFVTGPGSDAWTPIDGVGDPFTKVLFTTEDGGFYGHKGFCWTCIKDAVVENLKRGRFARGASTITQQLVKNLFFVEREKTIARKVQEAVTTWQIERTLDKRQMLALYLNIIELGPRIYGIKAASQHYFNRSPAELTLLQALWLASIVPNPRAFYHQFRDGKVSDSWKSYLCWIADVMLQREKITQDERDRLGDCTVVFGGAPDGSEPPVPQDGLGHEGDPDLGDPLAAPPKRPPPAPSVGPDEQP
jgi:hypothetical protein